MNRKAENEQLLEDVFAGAPEALRDAMFDKTLRVARRRRRLRQMNCTVLLSVLAIAVVLISRDLLRRPGSPRQSAAQPATREYQNVRTQPLPGAALVETRHVSTEFVMSSAEGIAIVRTTANNFRSIDDDQLLALLGSKPAALIGLGPHLKELVFANPADQDAFLGH